MMQALIAGALVAACAALALAWQQRRRTRTLETQIARLSGAQGEENAAATLARHEETLQKHGERLGELVSASTYLHRALQTAIRKIAFERYNPFPGLGGNQSFTLVLLDAHNSGVVLTTLHNRETTRMYAKGIRAGQPLQQLSEEEERTLKNALLQSGA